MIAKIHSPESAGARLLKIMLALALMAFVALTRAGADDIAQNVEIKGAWARATVPGQSVAGAYLQITSGNDARLVKIETPVARAAELHSMKMDNGVMRMRAVDSLPLPARETVTLVPGGYHLMLIDIKQQLKPGDSVPLRLTIQQWDGRAVVLSVTAKVRDAAP